MKVETYPAQRIPLGSRPKCYIDIPRGEHSYKDPQGNHILWCHSQGDRRFSPLVAELATGKTIEWTYQALKRDPCGQPISIRIGQDTKCDHFVLGGQSYPFHEWKHEVWYLLWTLYFLENPSLVSIVQGYQGFRDAFDGRGGECFYVDDPQARGEGYAGKDQCAAQSRALCWTAIGRPLHPEMRAFAERWIARYL